MKTFSVGKIYTDFDGNQYLITRRTEKSIWYSNPKSRAPKEKRRKIFIEGNLGEGYDYTEESFYEPIKGTRNKDFYVIYA